MKKTYQEIELLVILFTEEIVRTSQNDNVEDMPDFDPSEIEFILDRLSEKNNLK